MANATNQLVWWSLVVSLLVYLGVAHVVALEAGSASASAPLLRSLFALIGLGVAFGTIAYRRQALVEPIRSGRLDPRSGEGQQTAFRVLVVNLALSESVGIFGLVLALLSGDPRQSWPFVVGALILMFVHRPTASDLVPPASGASLP